MNSVHNVNRSLLANNTLRLKKIKTAEISQKKLLDDVARELNVNVMEDWYKIKKKVITI